MAAGLGFKDFVTGEVLTAADVDGYLMQGVWVFASAAARDAAVTSPQEGNFAYLKDTNVTTYYTGSAWANLDTTGMTNPMTTTGDTIYSSSGSTPARLGIGTAGQVLTVNSGATAPVWATPSAGGGGKVLQVLNLSLDAPATTSSATPSSTGLSLSITPSSVTSKILIFGSINGLLTTSGSCRFYLYKGASSIKNITSAGTVLRNASITFLDSPATTSATTYAIYFSTSAGTAYINDYVVASGDTTSQITVMEIGA